MDKGTGGPVAVALRPYQETAADFLFERDRAMILAPVGAGKTAITLTAMQDMILRGEVKGGGTVRVERRDDGLHFATRTGDSGPDAPLADAPAPASAGG